MKRTDKERIERSLKRVQKHQESTERRINQRADTTPGAFAKSLFSLLRYDDIAVYNTLDDEDVLELLLEMKETLPEKNWDVVIKKAVKSTKVQEKDQAVEELNSLLAD